jgi:hypothetical protein
LAFATFAVGWMPSSALADAPAPLPDPLNARLLALITSAQVAEQACIDPKGLAKLATSAPDYAVAIATLAAQAVRAAQSTVATAMDSQSDFGTPVPSGADQCQCLSEVAGGVASAVPNQAGEVYHALAEIAPDCRTMVAAGIRDALLDSDLLPVAPASSGLRRAPIAMIAPLGNLSPDGPGKLTHPTRTPPTGPSEPSTTRVDCITGGTCGTPLPNGDTQVESPTRLGGRG